MMMHPSIPKYVQLIEIIKNAIERQDLVPQQQLPNEDDLATQYDMSRGTVRKAIAELQRMGLVRKEQGRGTFINEPQAQLSGFSLVEFDQYVHAQNRTPSTQTLVFEIVKASDRIASKLDLPTGNDVFHIVQLRRASDVPIVYEERYFAKAWCPDLTITSLEKHTLHWLLVEKYQIPLIRLSHTIERSTLPTDKFELFDVEKTVPIFRVDRLSFTQKDEQVYPAVWYQALYRGDEYHFHTQFHSSI